MARKRIFIIIIILLAAVVGYFYITKFYLPQEPKEQYVYTAEDFPLALTTMDEELLQATLDDLNLQYQKIKEENNVHTRWINVGILKDRLHDYKGAERAWLKAIEVRPEHALAVGNLADLYLFELKEYDKAEEFYKRVLEMSPYHYNYYFGLVSLYRYNITEKADLIEGLMVEGANKNPTEAASYLLYLANYFAEGEEYSGGNDKDRAKYYSQKVLDDFPDLADQLPDL